MAQGPFKMKGSPMQRNFGIGSPMKDGKGKKDGRSTVQKLWDKYGPSINPKTTTEKDFTFKGDVQKTYDPGWGKTKKYEYTPPKSKKWTQSEKSKKRHKKK